MKQKEDAYTLNDLIDKARVYIKSEDDIKLIEKAYEFAKSLKKPIFYLENN